MATLAEIKDWFRTGLKPTQTQFWATWDSFWHKDTPIPQGAVQNLENTLFNKADATRLEEHINDTVAHSGGGSGGRFGIEDTTTSQDRVVDMNGNDFYYTEVGEINFSGGALATTLPYDENNMMFQQDNGANESTLSLSPLYPSLSSTLTASIDVDGMVSDFVFTLDTGDGYPEYYLEPAIIGTSVSIISITTIADTSAVNIGVNTLNINSTTEVTPGLGGYFSINGSQGFVSTTPDGETVGFRQVNDSGYPDLDGYSYMKFYQSWAYEPDAPETIAALVDIDGTATDILFNKYVHQENGNYWVTPAISGITVSLISYMAPTIIPARVVMTIPDDYNRERYGSPVYLDEQGLYKGNVPDLNSVLWSGSTSSFQGITLNNTTEYTMLNPNASGSGGGVKVKTFSGNQAETYYKRTGISAQNTSTGGVSLNFPVTSSSASAYNLALPERNGIIATTDQIPTTLQDIFDEPGGSTGIARRVVKMSAQSGQELMPGVAYGDSSLFLYESGGTGSYAELSVTDYYNFKTSISLHKTGAGSGVVIDSYNFGIKNVKDFSDSEFEDNLNYVTAGGVKKYFNSSLNSNLKTVNGISLLGTGNIDAAANTFKTNLASTQTAYGTLTLANNLDSTMVSSISASSISTTSPTWIHTMFSNSIRFNDRTTGFRLNVNSPTSVTSNVTQTFQDKSGTVALTTDITASATDIEITNPTKGYIMKDTVTGTRYRLQITNGEVVVTAVL